MPIKTFVLTRKRSSVEPSSATTINCRWLVSFYFFFRVLQALLSLLFCGPLRVNCWLIFIELHQIINLLFSQFSGLEASIYLAIKYLLFGLTAALMMMWMFNCLMN